MSVAVERWLFSFSDREATGIFEDRPWCALGITVKIPRVELGKE